MDEPTLLISEGKGTENRASEADVNRQRWLFRYPASKLNSFWGEGRNIGGD